uniref:Uncharacterized protein n=1 Tax=Tanacetum cinerariifolium TaxID=118510 RepID=A0A6L2LCZ2_TANCI|nr:hypothetical protein [Tanacetum cinerariifolium]
MSKLLYTRFTKLIINHFLSIKKSIPRRSSSKLHSSQDDQPIIKLLNIVKGDYKFGMEIPDIMISDAIKKLAGYRYYMAKKVENALIVTGLIVSRSPDTAYPPVGYDVSNLLPRTVPDTHFELKGQFLKELCDNTFSVLEHEDANEYIKKVLEIIDLFHIPKVTQDQIMLRALPVSLIEAEVILFYNRLDVPARQVRDSKGAIPSKTAAEAKIAI